MNKKTNEDFELTESVILAFEREKRDYKFSKKNKRKHKPKPKHRKKNKFVLTFLRIIFIFIFFACLLYILQWFYFNKKNKTMSDELSKYITVPTDPQNTDNNSDTDDNIIEEFSVDFDKLKEINKNCFAWLKVNGTTVSYPIVKCSNNSYYLTHSFDESYNRAGWPFADYRNTCDGYDKNLVIYGHNMSSGIMFASLENILKDDWCSKTENQIIQFYTSEGLTEYQIFSVYQIKAETYYTKTSFINDSAFGTFLNELKERSKYNFNVDVSSSDKILTLSTCADNSSYRIVLHAKKLQTIDIETNE